MPIVIKMKMQNLREEIEIPEGVTVIAEGARMSISKGKAKNVRVFRDPRIAIAMEGNKIVLQVAKATRKEKMQVGTFAAHLRNMIKGVNEQWTYKLKVCAGHFPMNIAISGKQFIVKNFVGEKVPRVLELPEGVEVKIEGSDITVTSHDKEVAGRTAGSIELLCRRPGFDPRVFQQGIYIVEKAGKNV